MPHLAIPCFYVFLCMYWPNLSARVGGERRSILKRVLNWLISQSSKVLVVIVVGNGHGDTSSNPWRGKYGFHNLLSPRTVIILKSLIHPTIYLEPKKTFPTGVTSSWNSNSRIHGLNSNRCFLFHTTWTIKPPAYVCQNMLLFLFCFTFLLICFSIFY